MAIFEGSNKKLAHALVYIEGFSGRAFMVFQWIECQSTNILHYEMCMSHGIYSMFNWYL